MKVCLIAEGSYPYTFGGVSAWVQMLIQGVEKDILQTGCHIGECILICGI